MALEGSKRDIQEELAARTRELAPFRLRQLVWDKATLEVAEIEKTLRDACGELVRLSTVQIGEGRLHDVRGKASGVAQQHDQGSQEEDLRPFVARLQADMASMQVRIFFLTLPCCQNDENVDRVSIFGSTSMKDGVDSALVLFCTLLVAMRF